MIKRLVINILTVVFVLALSIASMYGKTPDGLPIVKINDENISFRSGEKLTYVCHYKWGIINSDVAKGSVTITKDTIANTYFCRLYGMTAKFYDAFFKVREDLSTVLNGNNLKPLRFTRDTREGSYTAYDTYKYVWDKDNPHIEAKLNNSKRGARQLVLPINEHTYDFVTLLCMLRNIDTDKLKNNSAYDVSFALDDKVTPIKLIYIGKETVFVKGLGSVRALKFGMRFTNSEQFSNNADMFMWISDDKNKVPVYFEAPIRVGTVTGRLSSYSGLLHDFGSIVR